jgi:hypothetical protein
MSNNQNIEQILIDAQRDCTEKLITTFIDNFKEFPILGSSVCLKLQNYNNEFKNLLIKIFDEFEISEKINNIEDKRRCLRSLRISENWDYFRKKVLEHFINKFNEDTIDYAWIIVELHELYMEEETNNLRRELRKQGLKTIEIRKATTPVYKKHYKFINNYILKIPGGKLIELHNNKPPSYGKIDLSFSEEDNIMNSLERGGMD